MKKKILLMIAFVAIIQIAGTAQNGVGGGTKVVGPTKFKVDSLNDLNQTIGGKAGGGVDCSDLLEWDSIMVTYKYPVKGNIGLNCKVCSYQCIVQTAKGAQAFSFAGSKISNTLKAATLNCRKGDLIIFYNIKLYDSSKAKSIDSGPVFRVL